MEIKRVTDIQEILKCLPFEREIRKKGRDHIRESQMLLFIQNYIDSQFFTFLIAYDDENNILGYAVAYVTIMAGIGNKLHLSRLHAKRKGVFEALTDVLRQWAKEFNCKTVQISATKHIKAIQRRYKFIPKYVTLERRI